MLCNDINVKLDTIYVIICPINIVCKKLYLGEKLWDARRM